ncbi:MAG: lysylphosphatidylglycerol synthase transmembrane domain-containing protein [Planctomycetota bacterium]
MSAARNGLRRWLQPIVGVALLGVVLWFLPWRDVLVLKHGDKEAGERVEKVQIEGEVVGDWRGQRVEFVVDAGAFPSETPSWCPRDLARVALERDENGVWQFEGSALPGVRPDVTPGMPRVFSSVDPAKLGWALACFFVAMLFATTRWWRLLNRAGCRATWLAAFRLSYLGLFFNLVMPGLTGGDVVKAVLAVRENPARRSDALVSVVVDRLLGLFALAFLASVVVLFAEQYAPLRFYVPIVMVLMLAGSLVYTSRRVRKLLRFDRLLEKLPMAERFKSLDAAVVSYKRQPTELLWAFLLSLGNHFWAIVGVMALGIAFGVPLERVGFFDYLAIVPVANMVSSIPITPSGWGLGEAVYGYLFNMIGASASLGVAVSVGFRLCQLILGLAGGLYLLAPGARSTARAAEASAAEPDSGAA